MLALCFLMLSETYYAHNYGGIIGLGLHSPALATIGLTICSQMHVQIMYSLAYPQDLINHYLGWYKMYISEHTS